RQDVVLGPVDGLQDGAGGDHGDAVLGAAPTEHDGHARLARRLLGLLGEVLGAHIAMSVPVRRELRQRPGGGVAQRRSGLALRDISSLRATTGGLPSWTMPTTVSVMGMSTPCRRASSSTDSQDLTPSA